MSPRPRAASSPSSSGFEKTSPYAPPRAREDDRLLDAGEVAELLNVPARWVREQTRSGKLPHVQLGRYRRYDRADLLAYVEEQKAGGEPMSFRKHVPAVPRAATK